MRTITLIIVVVLLSLYSRGQNSNTAFEIYFGTGFSNDSVSLKINNELVLSNAIISSDLMLGLVDLNINADDSCNYFLTSVSYDHSRFKIRKKKNIEISLILNGECKNNKFNLKKGKYILIYYSFHDGCIIIEQRPKIPTFDWKAVSELKVSK